jgi:aryl-alcohol dehydrogenase-like predicted oxidoreductase
MFFRSKWMKAMVGMDGKMSKRELGKSGIQVTPIGLGVMQFSGGGGWFGRAFPVLSQEEKTAIVKAALDRGINWFDTAELYGFGVSEQSLAQGLKTLGVPDEQVIITTKWFPPLRTARNISHTIHDRLSYLDGYTIDLYLVHNPLSFSSPEAEMEIMADLVEASKIRSVGVSNFNPELMRRAHQALARRGLPLAVNQVHYSLIHRKIETDGTLETARELGVSIVAYTPLGYGLLTGIFHQKPELLASKMAFRRRRLQKQIEATRPLVEALIEIGDARQATPAQVALNWLVSFHGEAVVAIPGASKVRQAEENAGAMDFELTQTELDRLDEMSRQFR